MPTPRRSTSDRPAGGRARAAMSRARAVLIDDVIRELRRHDSRSEQDQVGSEQDSEREGARRPMRRRLRRRASSRPQS
jgi:hypothetical protein